jgi:hypothetical protein
MNWTHKGVLGAAVTIAMLGGGAMGAYLATPASSGAATTGATGASGSSGFHSNENPAHEKSESPQREADENAGRVHCDHHGQGGQGG